MSEPDWDQLYRRLRDGMIVKIIPPPKSEQFDAFLRAVRVDGVQYSVWMWKDFLAAHEPITDAPPQRVAAEVSRLTAENEELRNAAKIAHEGHVKRASIVGGGFLVHEIPLAAALSTRERT